MNWIIWTDLQRLVYIFYNYLQEETCSKKVSHYFSQKNKNKEENGKKIF